MLGLSSSLLFALLAAAPAGDAALDDAVVHARAQYEWFHAHPELSKQETKTAARLAAALRDLGLEVHEGIGGTGVVGVLEGAGPGPVVLYRADMDGLPVTEATGVPYASTNEGVMHACGHDVHMATALGALEVLARSRDTWTGTVLFVGQPAEEVGAGARAMLADPKFRRLLETHGRPTVAVALHDAADLPAGTVSIIEGMHHANVDSVDIVVHGKGGHGARPHETIDPIVIGAEIVMALQTIVSRRLRPDEKAVVTVGKFDAGTKHNIIPPSATLLLTVRSYGPKTRAILLREIERVARQVAKAHRAPRAPEVKVGKGLPSCENDPAWTKRMRAAFVAELGADAVTTHAPSLGGEDFGLFGTQLKIPAIMWKLGAVQPKAWAKAGGNGLPGLHSDQWAPDPDPTLRTGIRTAVAAIRVGLEG
ncbi:MAG: amidohydrolase [Myxococcota bacterium]